MPASDSASAVPGRRAAESLLVALAVWGALALWSGTLPGRRGELIGFDFMTAATTPDRIEAPIVIVGIDEPSFAELDRQWPWPRSLHAQLIERLKRAGAAVIAFDVMFAEPGEPAADRALAQAIRSAGNVILASDIAFQETEQFRQTMRVEPIPELREAGARSGMAGVALDPDLVVRAFPLDESAFWREVTAAYRNAAGTPSAGGADWPAPDSLIRYFGPDHAFRYVSFYQALDLEQFLPPGIFAGKIVLVGHDSKVGATPRHGGDAYATPYTSLGGVMTPGVEIQANLVADALAGRSVREVPAQLRLVALGAVALLASLLVRDRHPLPGALLSSALAAGVAVLALWLFSRDLWLPVLAPLLAVLAVYVSHVAIAYLRESRNRRQIEHAFRHYVSPEIVNEIVAHPERLALGGARRDITVMFTDLAGFTELSERLGPEEVAAFLNEYFTAMTDIVQAHGGTVDKFIGDSVMAFWGAPIDDAEQALHACRAAQEMQAALDSMRERFRARGLPEVHMRAGLHSGPAVVGNLGSANRFDYTAVGDTVNLASRLEGANKVYGTGVLVSGDTAAQLGGSIGLRQIDRLIVKGKRFATDVYTFCDDAETARLSAEALRHYFAREWAQAAAAAESLLARLPEDAAARALRDRIEAFRRDAPPQDWNGGIALEAK